MMRKFLKVTIFGVLALFTLFIVFGFVGSWLSNVSPETVSGLQSFKSVISDSTLISYAVIILMAVYLDPVVKFFIRNKEQRELLLNSKSTIRLCVAAFIGISEGLPLLLSGGWS